jgi:hypothetical protein
MKTAKECLVNFIDKEIESINDQFPKLYLAPFYIQTMESEYKYFKAMLLNNLSISNSNLIPLIYMGKNVTDFIEEEIKYLEFSFPFLCDYEMFCAYQKQYDEYGKILNKINSVSEPKPNKPKTEPVFPADAHSFEIFAIKDIADGLISKNYPSGTTKEAYIGYKLSNGNFEFKCIPYTEPIKKEIWNDAKTNPPKYSGRYWCYCAEVNSLGLSHFQANCYYIDNAWSENGKTRHVTHWTDLLSAPIEKPEPIKGVSSKLSTDDKSIVEFQKKLIEVMVKSYGIPRRFLEPLTPEQKSAIHILENSTYGAFSEPDENLDYGDTVQCKFNNVIMNRKIAYSHPNRYFDKGKNYIIGNIYYDDNLKRNKIKVYGSDMFVDSIFFNKI